MQQKSFATLGQGIGFERYGRATRKGRFLSRMEALVPWAEFCALIEPYYPKAGDGRAPVGLERMLRMYFIANWFNLADEACEDALHDIALFRTFCRIDLGEQRVPDATTLLGFRHLVEKHELGAAMFAKVGELLLANGLTLCGGTIVEATIIDAPGSTKNKDKARDPEMHQSRKGNQWYFGFKVHIGVDSKSGLIHSASLTPANTHECQELGNLLHGEETRLYGDSAYRGQKQRVKELAPKAREFTNERAWRHRELSEAQKATNRRKSSVRAKVEHPFLMLKRNWGFAKTRYRGLAKNANRVYTMLALINLDKWARPLTG